MKKAVIALAFLVGCAQQDSELVAKAKEAAAKRLKDPESAQFSDIDECPARGMVTGSINGKNAFGAYAGASPFVYEHGRVWMIEDLGLDAFLKAVDRCYGQKEGASRSVIDNAFNGTDPD